MIEFKHVSKTYGGKVKAVQDLDLKLKQGQIVGLIGPNGAGKTTIIKMLTGIIEPTQGQILINDIDITKDPLKAKQNFGFVPDSPDMFLYLKGIEYLNFMANIYNVSSDQRKERIQSLAEKFEMNQALNDKIQSYSHGMRQKIVIMGALIADPTLWILDEPMTGLDPQSSFNLKAMMKEHVKAGKTVIFSTHVLEVAEKLCDLVIVINHGKVIFIGTLSEIKEKYGENRSLEEIFIEMTNNE